MTKEKDEIVETKVDKDILNFLKVAFFGNFTDPIKVASSRAYRDMNRTLRFNGLPDATRFALREKVNAVFDAELPKLKSDSITNQDKFDAWHRNVSNKIKKLYLDKGVKFTYGHAQKWINMTIKYLYMLEANSFNDVFEFLHIPIDNYVFDIARDLLGIKKPKAVWSSWDNYNEQYLYYQNLIREKITTGTPLRWEFRCWLKAKRNIENKYSKTCA